MKHAILAILLALASTAAAGQTVRCHTSERIDGSLIRAGDSERKVIEAEPDLVRQLETAKGGAAGIRYDFFLRGRTVQIYVRSGVVVRACSIKEL